MYRLEIIGKVPSLNTIYGGTHWSKRKELCDQWHSVIGYACKVAKLPRTLPTPITLSVTQFCKGRVLDSDNAVLIAKWACDTLKEMGYIPEDSPAYVPTVILNARKGKEDKVVIDIFPYGQGEGEKAYCQAVCPESAGGQRFGIDQEKRTRKVG